ncbi:Aspartate/alanine antiporter [Fundidesulfovibrio magnetotacticus]|uniref:Aspartate/alanine antiporter n=1 Tax=Fundidesulfovibrio magnetotacticus TaxID=2730080 RepID=A0A6V8LQJ2_9BACT|nr:TrkA C-terminal domain-containing protein [Fundidesulfovibrio magnetotacticus]GFK93240.1 Aspartate/alanine antiporter [Fundidesulfovibrio magnetotacticus]
MVIDLAQLFELQPLLLFFAVLAAGYAVSRLGFRGVHLSAPVGVLVAGMLFGHFGFKAPPMLQEIGFTLFIYSVGLTAGPRFFNILLADGSRYLALTVTVALLAGATALGLGHLWGFSAPSSAGMLAGTLTSSPTLVAAQEALIQSNPDSHTALAQMGSAYALTYLVGLFSILALIRFAPVALRVDLAAEAKMLSRERQFRDDADDLEPAFPPPQLRAFQVERPELAGQAFERLDICRGGRCALQAVKRGGEVFVPSPGDPLEAGDLVALSMPVGMAPLAAERIGREVFDTDLLSDVIDTAEITVTSQDAAGRTLGELSVLARQGCTPVRLVRSHIPIAPRPDIVLEKGDLLTVAGLKHRLDVVVKALGYVERSMVETDLIAFVCGVLLGLWLGALKFRLGEVTVGLGQAGGLLASGLVFGFARSALPSFGRMPQAARWLLSELGLLFFMACVGLKAGEGVVAALRDSGLELLACGVTISAVSLFGGLAFGRFVLRMNPTLLFGAMAGAMTSTPALKVVTQHARSSLPALGYAGAYAFANVLLALLGALIARL